MGFKPGVVWSRGSPLPIVVPESAADAGVPASGGSERSGSAARSDRNYFVQIGEFPSGARAQELRAKTEQLGLRTQAWPGPSSDSVRIHAGPFASADAAESARARLEEIGQSLGFTPGPVWVK